MGDHSSVEVDAVGKSIVKSEERRSGTSKTYSWSQKVKKKKDYTPPHRKVLRTRTYLLGALFADS